MISHKVSTTMTMNLRNATSPNERANLVAQNTQTDLSGIASGIIDDLSLIHCENLIGTVRVPLGVAGPAAFVYRGAAYERLIPLATTEGALVASVSRGAKVISAAGGAVVDVSHVGSTRGPVFETSGIRESRLLEQWITSHQDELKEAAATTSKHLQLTQSHIQVNGKYVYVRFEFDTDEAMGMNMVTIATDAIVSVIEEHTKARSVAVAGNYDIDKKPGWLNVIRGRGRVCTAEVRIPPTILKEHLKVDPHELAKTVTVKCWGGSMMAGSMGYNAHFANMVAAFFTATGQDIAHTVEGSMGVTTAQVEEDGSLYFSIFMPDVMLGTVGGGTKLKTQTEARKITQAQDADELAAILAVAVLAGELSLLASITQKTLGKAHKQLGR